MEILKKYEQSLKKIIEMLDVLEDEKALLLKEFANADEKRRKELVKDLEESQNKFLELDKKMEELCEKIKNLKNQIC